MSLKLAKPASGTWEPPSSVGPSVINNAPTFNTLAADMVSKLNPQVGEQVFINVGASDPDGDIVNVSSFTITSRPIGSSAVLEGSWGDFLKAFTGDVAGDYTWQATVADDGGAARGASPATPLSSTITGIISVQPPPDFGIAGLAGVKKAVGILIGDAPEDGTTQFGTLFSVSCTSSLFASTAHGQVINTQILVTTAGTITGMTLDPHVYYLIPVDADHFRLSNSYDGAAISTFGNGSGGTFKTYGGAVTTARRLAAVIGRPVRWGGCNPGESSGDNGTVSGSMSGSTITFSSAHGLSVGDRVHNTGTSVAYWVKTVPSSTTLTLSVVKGGSAQSGSGTWTLKKHRPYGGAITLLDPGNAGSETSTWTKGNGYGSMSRVAIMPLYSTWPGNISNDGQSPPLHVRRSRRQEIAAGTWDVTYRAMLDLTHRTPAGAVTAVSATGVVTQTAHGWLDGAAVWFTSKTGGSGVATATLYRVILIDANTFKLATTTDNYLAGTAVSLGSNITAGVLKGRNADFRARTNEIDLPYNGGYPSGKIVPQTFSGADQGVVEPNDENEHKAMVEKIADLLAEFHIPLDYLGNGRNWPSLRDDQPTAYLWPYVKDLVGGTSTDTREIARYAFPSPAKLGAVAQNIYMGPNRGFSTVRCMQIVRGMQALGVEKGLPVGFGERGTYFWNSTGPSGCTWVVAGKFTAPSGTLASNGITTGTRVVVSLAGTRPTNISALVAYWVRDVSGDTFNLAATSGGAAISLTGAFSGAGMSIHSDIGTTDNTKFVYLTSVTAATDGTFTKTAHGLTNNQSVTLWDVGTLTGYAQYTSFVVRDVTANTFKLAAWPRLGGVTGSAITIASSATGIGIVDASNDAMSWEWQFWQFWARCPASGPGSLLYSNHFWSGDFAITKVNDTDMQKYAPSTWAAIYATGGLVNGA